jgi:hypothetical protein
LDLIVDSVAGSAPWQGQFALLAILVCAAGGGFALGRWLAGERVRQAEWQLRRSEAMCTSLRKLSDDYRKRLSGRSPEQAERKLKEQERKLGVLRFQVASLTGELKSIRTPSPADETGATIELSSVRFEPEARKAS